MSRVRPSSSSRGSDTPPVLTVTAKRLIDEIEQESQQDPRKSMGSYNREDVLTDGARRLIDEIEQESQQDPRKSMNAMRKSRRESSGGATKKPKRKSRRNSYNRGDVMTQSAKKLIDEVKTESQQDPREGVQAMRKSRGESSGGSNRKRNSRRNSYNRGDVMTQSAKKLLDEIQDSTPNTKLSTQPQIHQDAENQTSSEQENSTTLAEPPRLKHGLSFWQKSEHLEVISTEHLQISTSRRQFTQLINQRDQNKKTCVHILSVLFYILVFVLTVQYDFSVSQTSNCEAPFVEIGREASQKVKNKDQLWGWMQKTFMPRVLALTDANGQITTKPQVLEYYHTLAGVKLQAFDSTLHTVCPSQFNMSDMCVDDKSNISTTTRFVSKKSLLLQGQSPNSSECAAAIERYVGITANRQLVAKSSNLIGASSSSSSAVPGTSINHNMLCLQQQLRVGVAAEVEAMKNKHFISKATLRASIELVVFTAQFDRYVVLAIGFDFLRSGVVKTSFKVISVPTSNKFLSASPGKTLPTAHEFAISKRKYEGTCYGVLLILTGYLLLLEWRSFWSYDVCMTSGTAQRQGKTIAKSSVALLYQTPSIMQSLLCCGQSGGQKLKRGLQALHLRLKAYFIYDAWNALDLTVYFLVLANICLLLFRESRIKDVQHFQGQHDTIELAATDLTGAIGRAALSESWLLVARGICIIFMGVRLLKPFGDHPKLAIVTNTLKIACEDLQHFAVIFLPLFAGYVLAGHVLFGTRVSKFATMADTAITCMNIILLGEHQWDELFSSNKTTIGYVAAVVWFWSFLCLMFLIMLNILLAIVMDSYAAVKQSLAGLEFEEDVIALSLWESCCEIIRDIVARGTTRRCCGKRKGVKPSLTARFFHAFHDESGKLYRTDPNSAERITVLMLTGVDGVSYSECIELVEFANDCFSTGCEEDQEEEESAASENLIEREKELQKFQDERAHERQMLQQLLDQQQQQTKLQQDQAEKHQQQLLDWQHRCSEKDRELERLKLKLEQVGKERSEWHQRCKTKYRQGNGGECEQHPALPLPASIATQQPESHTPRSTGPLSSALSVPTRNNETNQVKVSAWTAHGPPLIGRGNAKSLKARRLEIQEFFNNQPGFLNPDELAAVKLQSWLRMIKVLRAVARWRLRTSQSKTTS